MSATGALARFHQCSIWMAVLLTALSLLQGEAFVVPGFVPPRLRCANARLDSRQRRSVHMEVAQGVPSWEELREGLPTSTSARQELVADRLSGAKDVPSGRLVLFRDRNGWCPYSERVWLAMMEKQLDFDEVLINLQAGKPSWYSSVVASSQTPAIRTAEGEVVYDSLRVLEYLEEAYPERPLLPESPAERQVALNIMNKFSKVMPSGSRPSSRGAFLFKGWGASYLSASEFEASLDAIEELLQQSDGPFFSGTVFGLADCAFAPFLERWSFQVPAVRPGLHPRDQGRWPALAEWYDAMEAHVSSYMSRVKGDRHTWTMALEGAGGGDTARGGQDWLAGFADADKIAFAGGEETGGDGGGLPGEARERVWAQFASGREWVGQTAREEAARRLWEGRERVRDDAMRKCGIAPESRTTVEQVLRATVHLLLRPQHNPNSAGGRAEARALLAACDLGRGADGAEIVQKVASHLGGRICCPRDMGVLAASELRSQLAALYFAIEE